MKILDRIVFKEPPPVAKQDNELWAEGGRLKFKPIGSPEETLAFTSEIPVSSYTFVSPLESKSHTIVHNLNSSQLFVTVQIDKNGDPDEYIYSAVITPSPLDPGNIIHVDTDIPIKIHVALLKMV